MRKLCPIKLKNEDEPFMFLEKRKHNSIILIIELKPPIPLCRGLKIHILKKTTPKSESRHKSYVSLKFP